MSLSPAFLDELRARVPVSGVVGRRVKLTRAGREMKGCCPFHNEKTASFYVNDDKGFYHCFGCGVHGDVIRFLTDNMGLPFIEAVKQLAAEAGLEIPAATPEAREKSKVADSLAELTARAANWFQAQLAGDAGTGARAYLDRRGVPPALGKHFGLGFALDGRIALRSHLADVEADKLLDAGLIGKSEQGEIFDRFRGRLMFPIRDRRGRVLGFGGRALGDVQPKYLNSADGPLFDKGRVLYNLDLAGPAARQSGRLIVVEGYMDVIGLAGAGIAEAVAPLGTAMTEAQLTLAWRLVDEPVLCFDGDAAGLRAATRAAGRALPLLQPGKSLRIATLPPGQDPDDLCRSGGAVAFETVLAAAVPLIDHIWASESVGLEQATPERRAQARTRLREAAASIADPDVRSLYQAEFNSRFEAAFLSRPARPAWQPRKPGEKWQPPTPPATAYTKSKVKENRDQLIDIIINSIRKRPSLLDRYGDQIAVLSSKHEGQSATLQAINDYSFSNKGYESNDLEEHFKFKRVNQFLFSLTFIEGISLSEQHATESQSDEDFAASVILATAREGLQQSLHRATEALQSDFTQENFDLQQELRAQLAELTDNIKELAYARRQ